MAKLCSHEDQGCDCALFSPLSILNFTISCSLQSRLLQTLMPLFSSSMNQTYQSALSLLTLDHLC